MSGLYDHEMHRLLRCLGVDPGEATWVARSQPLATVVPFGTEIEALRHAIRQPNGSSMEVVHVPHGEDALTYREPL